MSLVHSGQSYKYGLYTRGHQIQQAWDWGSISLSPSVCVIIVAVFWHLRDSSSPSGLQCARLSNFMIIWQVVAEGVPQAETEQQDSAQHARSWA